MDPDNLGRMKKQAAKWTAELDTVESFGKRIDTDIRIAMALQFAGLHDTLIRLESTLRECFGIDDGPPPKFGDMSDMRGGGGR